MLIDVLVSARLDLFHAEVKSSYVNKSQYILYSFISSVVLLENDLLLQMTIAPRLKWTQSETKSLLEVLITLKSEGFDCNDTPQWLVESNQTKIKDRLVEKRVRSHWATDMVKCRKRYQNLRGDYNNFKKLDNMHTGGGTRQGIANENLLEQLVDSHNPQIEPLLVIENGFEVENDDIGPAPRPQSLGRSKGRIVKKNSRNKREMMMDSLTKYMDNQTAMSKSISEATELDQDKVDLGYMNLIGDKSDAELDLLQSRMLRFKSRLRESRSDALKETNSSSEDPLTSILSSEIVA